MFAVLRGLFQRSNSQPRTEQQVYTPHAVTPTRWSACVFIDTETTGLNQDGTDEVLEIAIVDMEGNALLNTFVRPVRNTAWPIAQAIHGISPSDVSTAPSWGELLPEIAAHCSDKTVVFYNSDFDTGFFPVGFFPNVMCAMRRYSDANPAGSGWGKLIDVASSSGYVPTGAAHRALEDALACRHVWLVGIPALLAEYPEIGNPNMVASITIESDKSMPLMFNEVYPDQLRFLNPGEICKIWTKEDRGELVVFRPGTVGGRGRIASLSKANNRELAQFLELNYTSTMKFVERRGDNMLFDVEVVPPKKALLPRALPKTPVDYSAIDNDIYSCFISHQSGMCDAIGSHQEFRHVENEITRICKEKGGRYYKSKAKGAKFAIIFSPHAQTDGDIWDLQEQGYKVTSFDKAVLYFGLNSLWNCPAYVAYVNRTKRQANKTG